MSVIRPYRVQDEPAIARICLRTGHAGQDATPYYPDGELLADLYTRPFLAAEPELASVAEVDGEVVGYLVGTADTARFAAWFRDVWLPPLAGRHPPGGGEPGSWAAIMTAALYAPEAMVRPELAGHPAQLHTNLLPDHQRRGLGTRMIHTFLQALADRGVPAVHVAHGKYNISARIFYKRLGFTLLPVPDPGPVRFLGRPTEPVEPIEPVEREPAR